MEKTKRLIIKLAVLLAIVAVLFVLSFIGYQHALRGVKTKNAILLDSGVDSNDLEYRVVLERKNDVGVRIAYQNKNAWGIWKDRNVEDRTFAQVGLVAMGWANVAGFKRFAVDDTHPVEFETHIVYCGNNAVKQISIPPDMLPDNLTVNIQQCGSFYILHFITFGDSESTRFDPNELLMAEGCIQ